MSEVFKAILIDDEPYCTKGLEIELKKHCPTIEVIATSNSVKEGIKLIKKLQPDVVFLDIEMPWMSGFELIDLLNPVDFEVIFVTAYDQFAVQAFRICALDYLMKPISPDGLIEAVDKLKGRSKIPTSQQKQIEYLLQYIQEPIQTNPKLSVPSSDGIDLIPIDSIVYCKANDSYTEIIKTDGTKLLVSRVLKKIAAQLADYDFERVHQSYLINMSHLSRFHRSDGGYVEMINGDRINVSRSKKTGLIQRINKFIRPE